MTPAEQQIILKKFKTAYPIAVNVIGYCRGMKNETGRWPTTTELTNDGVLPRECVRDVQALAMALGWVSFRPGKNGGRRWVVLDE